MSSADVAVVPLISWSPLRAAGEGGMGGGPARGVWRAAATDDIDSTVQYGYLVERCVR